jgi:galactokinase
MRLLKNYHADFNSLFSLLTPSLDVHSPGRVNLIGEHTDYNGGNVLPFAIAQGIQIRCARGDLPVSSSILAGKVAPAFIIASDLSPDVFVTTEQEMAQFVTSKKQTTKEDLPPEIQSNWVRFAAGALAIFAERVPLKLPQQVLGIYLKTTLPPGGGLSSSAAFCIGLLQSLNAHFGFPLPGGEVARMAMWVEHRFAGTKCGLMDQLAVEFSREGHFTKIDFLEFPEHGKYSLNLVKAHPVFEDYEIFVLNTGVTHSLANSEYNLRRSTCEDALALLNKKAGLQEKSLGAYARKAVFEKVFARTINQDADTFTPEFLAREFFAEQGDKALVLSKRATHAILENHRVERASKALQEGNIAILDKAMRDSHKSLNEWYEVSCEELNIACELVTSKGKQLAAEINLMQPAVVGSRMTGGGFGGSTVQLVHKSIAKALQACFEAPQNEYQKQTQKKCSVMRVSSPRDGFRIQVI